MRGAGPVRGVRGRRLAPSVTATTASGTFTATAARQPPRPIARPPSVGPITEIVCVDTESTVRMPAGLASPVRRDSLRIRYIAAG